MSGNTPPPPGTPPDAISLFFQDHPILFWASLGALAATQFWTIAYPYRLAYAERRKLRFRQRISNTVRLSTTKTGYIGAFLAKKTISVTLHLFAVSFSIFLLTLIPFISSDNTTAFALQSIIRVFILINAIAAIYTAYFVRRLCHEIVKRIEGEDQKI